MIIQRKENNGYGLRPNFKSQSFGANIETNKYGFRKSSIPYKKGKSNWLLLGDSVLMGVGVNKDSTFAGRMSSEYINWNIINSGVIGFSSEDYITQLNYVLKFLNIQKVSLFFCLNDIYVRNSKIAINVPGKNLRKIFGASISFLRKNSVLYLMIKNKVFDRSKSYFTFDNNLYLENEILLKRLANNLVEIQSILNKKKIPFEIYLLPYEFQLRDNDISIDNPQRKLTDLIEGYSITTKDLFEYMSNKSDGNNKKLFLYGDPMHLSNKGHNIVFNFIKSKN